MSRDTEFFWSGLRRDQLLFQVCDACATPRHPPRPTCAQCGSRQWTARPSTGSGTIHSFTVVHRPAIPGYQMPYAVGLVDLEAGIRMVGRIVDVDLDDIAIGTRVTVRYEDEDGGRRPVFVPTWS